MTIYPLICHHCLSHFSFWSEWKDVILMIVGAFLGTAITLFVERFSEREKQKKYDLLYKQYEGIYVAFDKFDHAKPYHVLELTREKNVFKISKGKSLSGTTDFQGDIQMEITNPNYGRGYYRHLPDSKGIVGFGFLEIQLSKDMILVHVNFYVNGQEQPNPYIWKKQVDLSLQEAIEKYKPNPVMPEDKNEIS